MVKIPKTTLAEMVESKIVGLVEELACLYGKELGISYIPIKPVRKTHTGVEIQWKK